MKDLVIIGAGGLGRSIYQIATECDGYQKDFNLKGFLDDNLNALSGLNGYPPIISTIADYSIAKNDIFICSIGTVNTKKIIVNSILKKGGNFLNLIHPLTQISKNVEIGIGCTIARNVILGPDSHIGNFVLIQASVVIGHDSKIGNYSRIDCNAVCVGGVIIEDEAIIHTAAILNHNVVVEKNATVGAGSFVIRRVKENTTVFGNPATRLK